MHKYILNANGEPVVCDDIVKWGKWFENGDARRVAKDEFDDVMVSTVFLGLDHSFGFGGPPVLWETMIFGGKYADSQWRWTSRETAQRGHERILALLKAGRDPESDDDLPPRKIDL